jgi:hypothetical protein
LPRRDASLARTAQSTYVRAADGYYSRMCRVQPPGAAPEPAFFGRFQRFPAFPEPARAARPQGGTVPEPGWRPIPGTHASRDGFERRYGHNRTRRGPSLISSARSGAADQAISDRQAAHRRQTCSDGPTLDAPDCVATPILRTIRADAGRQLRAASSAAIARGAAPRVALRPSPHPRIRWTVASPLGAVSARGQTRPPPPRVQKCRTKC